LLVFRETEDFRDAMNRIVALQAFAMGEDANWMGFDLSKRRPDR
jgi:hypothetical protein